MHIDTGPLTLTEPLSLAGSWVALEDVQPLSGEFQFVPGSHRLPELLHYGTDKAHHFDYDEFGKILSTTLRMCEERGLETKTFMAEKGDVLIWHGDLMHGGVQIQDSTRTRKSLIAHLMPLGVLPTFFDFSEAVVPYAGGGYSIDVKWSDMISAPTMNNGSARRRWQDPSRSILWRSWVPLSARRRIPPPRLCIGTRLRSSSLSRTPASPDHGPHSGITLNVSFRSHLGRAAGANPLPFTVRRVLST